MRWVLLVRDHTHPLRPVELRSLRLEIPRRADTARYLHATRFTWGEQVSRELTQIGGEWTSSFMPYVWLGDEERGLAWCCESEQGWQVTDQSRALEVRHAGDTTLLIVTVLDHAETVTSPITLRFGLQAAPVKPVSFEWRARARLYHSQADYSMAVPDADGKIPLDALRAAGVRTLVFHDMWTDYFGKVSTPHGEELRGLIAECHKRGMKLLVYKSATNGQMRSWGRFTQ